jgi:hypothetical protein
MFLRTDKARRDWHPDLSNPPAHCPCLASGQRMHRTATRFMVDGARGSLIRRSIWGGAQPVCQPAPSATLLRHRWLLGVDGRNLARCLRRLFRSAGKTTAGSAEPCSASAERGLFQASRCRKETPPSMARRYRDCVAPPWVAPSRARRARSAACSRRHGVGKKRHRARSAACARHRGAGTGSRQRDDQRSSPTEACSAHKKPRRFRRGS